MKKLFLFLMFMSISLGDMSYAGGGDVTSKPVPQPPKRGRRPAPPPPVREESGASSEDAVHPDVPTWRAFLRVKRREQAQQDSTASEQLSGAVNAAERAARMGAAAAGGGRADEAARGFVAGIVDSLGWLDEKLGKADINDLVGVQGDIDEDNGLILDRVSRWIFETLGRKDAGWHSMTEFQWHYLGVLAVACACIERWGIEFFDTYLYSAFVDRFTPVKSTHWAAQILRVPVKFIAKNALRGGVFFFAYAAYCSWEKASKRVALDTPVGEPGGEPVMVERGE